MNINISITTWINRILMTPFLIFLVISIADTSYLFYSIYIALVLGCFQIFSSLITLFYYKILKNFNLILLYLLLVVLYFFSSFLFFEFEKYIANKDIILIIFWIVPIPLSLFWTYILENIKKEI